MNIYEHMPAEFNLSEYLLNETGEKDKQLLYFNGGSLSKLEVEQKVKVMAASFLKKGMSKDERVLLLLNDSPEFISCFLAVMALGAIPVPLSPKLKSHNIDHILSDSGAKYIIMEVDNDCVNNDLSIENINQIASGFVLINDMREIEVDKYVGFDIREDVPISGLSNFLNDFDNSVESFQYANKQASDIAFWQYSSGTTGLPKAVQHNQVGMLYNTECFCKETLGIGSEDKIYSVPKMFFGYGLGNSLFFPFITNASVFIDSEWPNPQRITENLKFFQPTVFFGVPAVYNMLLKSDFPDFSDIRICFSAGATLPGSIYKKWMDKYEKPILDGIGATEVGHVFITNSLGRNKENCTGYLVQEYDAKILDQNEREVPVGEQGTLWVKGPSVSPGYWGRSELNTTKFKDGWYRTGDVFVKNYDESFFYCGREDDVFKVNGRWVVPSEIENLVNEAFLEIAESALVGRELDDSVVEPVLFIAHKINEMEKDALLKEIREYLKQTVESFKMPKDIIILDEFPRNSNGKLLKYKLKEISEDLVSELNKEVM